MPTERIFLDWSEPCLSQAALWLKDQLDRHSVIVTPGARSGRRLMERLVEQAGGQLLNPPRIITLGHLAESLLTPSLPIASFAAERLILAGVLSQMPTDLLSSLLAEPPSQDDLRSWLELAGRLIDLFNTLAGGNLQASDVLDYCGTIENISEVQRWEVLSEIYQNYVPALTHHQFTDANLARFEAIKKENISFSGRLFLVGTVDINKLTCQILQRVAGQCVALIHAPESMADHFGAFGELKQRVWLERPLAIDPQNIRTAVLPEDQIRVVFDELTQLSSPRVNDITLGTGDEQMGPLIEHLTVCANIPTRWPRGRPPHLSRPVTLLTAIGAYAAGRQTRDMAVLLRHPDMAIKLQHTLEFEHTALLDQYISRYLQLRLSSESPSGKHLVQLQKIKKVIDDLFCLNRQQQKTLSAWSGFVEELLAVIYEPQQFSKHLADDLSVIESLRAIGHILEQWASIEDTQASTLRSISFQDALSLLTAQLQKVVLPKPSDEPAIEILGWLELHLDDAPNLFICGFNEGLIPGPLGADAFLPDSIRQQLGLSCDQARLARDRYMLEAILNSRPNVKLIAGRFDAQGQPLMPSRLTLMDDPVRLPDAIERFSAPPQQLNIVFLPSAKDESLATQWMPRPTPPPKPITELSVTAFKDYLACPYRFYLKYICHLRQPDAFELQLGAGAFGNLAHEVLGAFGADKIADSTQASEIKIFLCKTLATICHHKYGKTLLPAVRIQCEQLKLRFEIFARQQAQWRASGWHIVSERVETELQVNFPVDDFPFTLKGRIDRIDRHDNGHYCIIDYKTGNSAKLPDAAHRVGPKSAKTWTNLQLPLYRHLAQSITLDHPVQLGYFLLTKKPADIGFSMAPWNETDLEQATEQAREIIRDIRRGIFWPPKSRPGYSDGLEGICQDDYPYRDSLIDLEGCGA